MFGRGNGKWVRVGSVSVDSGTVMVVDPCYVLRDKRNEDKGEDNGLEYSKALGFDLPEDDPRYTYRRDEAQKAGDYLSAFALGTDVSEFNPKGIMEYGFFFPSGYGDGSYPIWAKIYDEGQWGERVGGIYVDFGLGDPKDEDDEEDDYFEDEDEVDELEGSI